MALSTFSLALAGLETGRAQRIPLEPVRVTRASRRPPRPMSKFNTFQTACVPSDDEPPSYALASTQRVPEPQWEDSRTPPPAYTCTIAAEANLQLAVESVNPLGELAEHDWRGVHAILQGTVLHLYKVKKDGTSGRLLKSYTLQHAEVGLAVDTSYSRLMPRTRLARLIPSAVQKMAWHKDPELFTPVKQTVLRLRVESDQIVLADASEERVFEWVDSISAAIDISAPIDDRTLPSNCSVPRRRRRRAHHTLSRSLADPAMVVEQERLMREMYPSFAERQTGNQMAPPRNTTTDDTNADSAPMTGRGEDELDLNVMQEDFISPRDSARRPTISRHTTASSGTSIIADGEIATTPANLNTAGKWEPPHPRTPAQAQRYIRRCMPILHADAARASDVLIHQGMRAKINWRMEMLEKWELKPPSYRSHHFTRPNPEPTPLERSESRASTATSESPESATSGRETDDIEAVQSGRPSPLSGVDLDKTPSVDSLTRTASRTMQSDTERKRLSDQVSTPGVQSAVFCF